MQIAMIGLGRMGMNMAKRLLQGGHSVIAYNRTPNKTDQLVKEGAIGAYSLGEVVEKLSPPRVTWVMLPAGPTVDDHIVQLKEMGVSGIYGPGASTEDIVAQIRKDVPKGA